MAEDYYRVLGVARKASQKEIREAYRRLARRYHPDINSDNSQAETKFKKVNEAHDVLGDEHRRKDYDDFGKDWKHATQIRRARSQGGMGGGFKLDDIFGGMGLGDLFGGRHRQSQGRSQSQTEISLSLLEVLTGAVRTLVVATPQGKRQIEVRIPPGIEDRGRVVVRPQGIELVVVVRVTPDKRFTRHGANLHCAVAVPLKIALLGGVVDVPTLEGKRLELKIAADTQNGKHIRLGGKGLPHTGYEGRGDLIAIVDVRLPSKLSESGRKFAQDLDD